MKKSFKLILFIVLIINYSEANAQIYSFEDGLIPANWSTNSGTLTVATNKYKLGTKSLRWDWIANSRIIISNPSNIAASSISSSGGITIWVYNTIASATNKLVFSGINSSLVTKCHIDFGLNFKGWRSMWAEFVSDMGHDKTTLNSITIQAPSTGSGTVYFDYVEFPSSMLASINSDAQYIVNQDSGIDDFQGVRLQSNFVAATAPTQAQISSVDTIINRLDTWFLSKKLYPTASEYVTRKSANSSWMSSNVSTLKKITFTTDTDGAISGGIGLFPDIAPSTVDGLTIKSFTNYHGNLLPVALDYRINGTASSKTSLLNMYDWYNDQGWADGSGMGSIMYEKLRVAGYIHSVFLMRNDLGTTRLAREANTLSWFSMIGSANLAFSHYSENSDMIRTMVMAKLYAALLQADVNKRITALTALTNYYNNAFSPASGYLDSFKPDYSGYHHFGPYLGAYYCDALYAACLTYYLLHGTPYQLSEGVFNQLKQSLLTYRLFCANYDVPSSANGRFPGNTTILSDILPTFAYLALARTTPDQELLAAFSKYWKTSVDPMKSMIADASIDICQKRTLGEVELCLTAAKLAVPAESSIKASFYMPYSGLMVNRGINRLSSVKGFNRYIAGFESVSPSDNLYGRNLNFGQIEYISLINGKKNNAYNQYSWDWSRIPGTTSKYMAKASLYYLTTGSHRVFGDQSYLGGPVINDSTSAFSFKLHDNFFDASFYAYKSVFTFGNVLVCLGSKISNNSTTARTETTLLQHAFNKGESFKVNGTELAANLTNLSQPIIRDNLGNRFIVKVGNVDVFKGDTLYSAVINHGLNPKDETYAYYMLLQSSDAQEANYSNSTTDPIQLIRRDTIAHIVKHKTDKVWGYSIFNSSITLNDSLIKQVNTPSIVMIKAIDSSIYRIVISDPDMHRPYYLGSGSFPISTASATATPFGYEIVLNGVYQFNASYPNVTLTIIGNTTKIAFNTQDGNSYTFDLKNSVSVVTDTTAASIYCIKNGDNEYKISSNNEEPFDIGLVGIDGKIIKQYRNIRNSYNLDLKSLSKGIYLLKVQNSSQKIIQKLILN